MNFSIYSHFDRLQSQTTSPKAGLNVQNSTSISKCKLRCDQKHSTDQNGETFDSKYKHYKLKTSIAKPLPRYRLKILSPYNMHKDDLAGEFLIHDYNVSSDIQYKQRTSLRRLYQLLLATKKSL